MIKSVFKLTFRSIRNFFGRYAALMLIVMLSAGFFSGLKITKDAMRKTGEEYFNTQNFYDYRLISTDGFNDEDVKALGDLEYIESAEGVKSIDIIVETGEGTSACKMISIPDKVSLPSLKAGRMPEMPEECLADAEFFSESDIGTEINVSDDNINADYLIRKKYTIVGLADSPCYLNGERGTTSIGSGVLKAFFYIPEKNFVWDFYNEVQLSLIEKEPVYSDAYDRLIDKYEDDITAECNELVQENFDRMLSENNMTRETAEMFDIKEPECYIMTRDENTGYVSFENDTEIVSGIADVFPLFFVLIAILVCMTTMTRMIDEERTQIGTLKSMGFTDAAITAKYMLYSGSAALTGWAVGFFVGTIDLPQVFWLAYGSIYDFADMDYLFSPKLAGGTLAVSVLGMLGGTWISCRRELSAHPAALIRPAAPKNGKRILLERITPFWNRLTFLQKVSFRNMFRYKQRLIMMLIGIGCCSALVTAAFGVRDSMIDVGRVQYEEIQLYDIEASCDSSLSENELDGLVGAENHMSIYSALTDVSCTDTMNNVKVIGFANEELKDFWSFKNDGEQLPLPEQGEALISCKTALNTGADIGDIITVRNSEMKETEVSVSGIFDNYAYSYVVMRSDDVLHGWGSFSENTVYIRTDKSTEDIMKVNGIISAAALIDTRKNIDDALGCLNYIVWIIVLFSGALAFIVIYNLTNINIAERSREIATVQVLGFYPKETNSYVLRENLILSLIAGAIGLPAGTFLHSFVMNRIVVDTMTFQKIITPQSYALSMICTVVFAFVVNLVMRRKIAAVHMAESLKAVE